MNYSFSENYSKYFFLLIITSLFIFFESCSNNLPVKKNLQSSFSLINQDSNKVVFPDDFKGRHNSNELYVY